MTIEEKRQLNKERTKAVRAAWRHEETLVQDGKGTRQWTVEQQKELLEKHRVVGYDGHHMKSVSEYPEYAGDYRNIQFLEHEKEHINGAHQGSTWTQTNGYWNYETRAMEEFNGNELREAPIQDLNEKYEQNHTETHSQDYEESKEQTHEESYSYDFDEF